MKDYKLIIPREVFDKINHWVHKATRDEISGFGNIVVDHKEKTFEVIDAILLKQENAGSSTDIDAQSLSQAMYRMRNTEGEMKWWWHSHVQMATFWSGTDMTTIEELGDNGWILATVFNQKNERRTAFFTKSVSEFGDHEVFADEMTTVITSYYDQSLFDAWNKEYTDNVTGKKWVSPVRDLASGKGASSRTLEEEISDCFENFQSVHFKTDSKFEWLYSKYDHETKEWREGHWAIRAEHDKDRLEILKAKRAEIREVKLAVCTFEKTTGANSFGSRGAYEYD